MVGAWGDRGLIASAPWWRAERGTRLMIEGGHPLHGSFRIAGAKNAALPLMIATLLTPHLVTLHNVPGNLDVAVLASLLGTLGAALHWSEAADGALSVTISASCVHPERVDPGRADSAGALVGRMRASVLLLGALLARSGRARLPMPGGDAIGLRAIDFHVMGLRALGAEVSVADGIIEADAPNGLTGAEIALPHVSVGATENIMIAAAGACGRTVIRNAAREPEIDDLALLLRAMGVAVEGAQSGTIEIEGCGFASLRGPLHRVMPDRIELGTAAVAAALTDGELLLTGVGSGDAALELLGAGVGVFAESGVALAPTADGLRATRAPDGLRAADVVTQPYPGFATDLQAPVLALLANAEGASSVTETIFEQRFRHVDELRRMGADITVRGRTALIRGVGRLQSAAVEATDVRAASCLLVAGMAADGRTSLGGLEHLDRGHDGIVERLAACGASLIRL